MPACEQICLNNIPELPDESHTLETSKAFFDHEEKMQRFKYNNKYQETDVIAEEKIHFRRERRGKSSSQRR